MLMSDVWFAVDYGALYLRPVSSILVVSQNIGIINGLFMSLFLFNEMCLPKKSSLHTIYGRKNHKKYIFLKYKKYDYIQSHNKNINRIN